MGENKHICKYCGKEFKSGQSLGAHVITCKLNPNSIKIKLVYILVLIP